MRMYILQAGENQLYMDETHVVLKAQSDLTKDNITLRLLVVKNFLGRKKGFP